MFAFGEDEKEGDESNCNGQECHSPDTVDEDLCALTLALHVISRELMILRTHCHYSNVDRRIRLIISLSQWPKRKSVARLGES
jgi:hypothetical protein